MIRYEVKAKITNAKTGVAENIQHILRTAHDDFFGYAQSKLASAYPAHKVDLLSVKSLAANAC